jgi:hypothetical protein
MKLIWICQGEICGDCELIFEVNILYVPAITTNGRYIDHSITKLDKGTTIQSNE